MTCATTTTTSVSQACQALAKRAKHGPTAANSGSCALTHRAYIERNFVASGRDLEAELSGVGRVLSGGT